jgi:hypothetical protein
MEAPKLPSFIRQNRYKNFEFKPRYYNESEERISKLKTRYESMTSSDKNASQALRAELRERWGEDRQAKVKSSNRSLFLILIALCALVYFILFRLTWIDTFLSNL